jgi:hypothetical protein
MRGYIEVPSKMRAVRLEITILTLSTSLSAYLAKPEVEHLEQEHTYCPT